MLQNATLLNKSPPWPPNISDEHVSCAAPATRNASFQILLKCPTPAIVFGNVTKPSRFAHFWQGAQSFPPATRNDIWTSKSGPNTSLYILIWTCASHHNGEHFFHILTSKSGPNLVCFVHFDLEMCFAPQRRALFPHLNFQKCSIRGVLCTFWLGNVLRATTACSFSSFIWPHGSAPAALASPLFEPPEPQIIGKTCFATFRLFRAPGSSFLGVLFLIFFLLLFSSLTLPTCACPSVHTVGSLTSKLPSIIIRIYWVQLAKTTMVAQQQPKSHLSKHRIATANGDRENRKTQYKLLMWFPSGSSGFVTLIKQGPTADSVAHGCQWPGIAAVYVFVVVVCCSLIIVV